MKVKVIERQIKTNQVFFAQPTDSRRDSEKIVLCSVPALTNSTATPDDSRHQLTIPGSTGIPWSKEHGPNVFRPPSCPPSAEFNVLTSSMTYHVDLI